MLHTGLYPVQKENIFKDLITWLGTFSDEQMICNGVYAIEIDLHKPG